MLRDWGFEEGGKNVSKCLAIKFNLLHVSCMIEAGYVFKEGEELWKEPTFTHVFIISKLQTFQSHIH